MKRRSFLKQFVGAASMIALASCSDTEKANTFIKANIKPATFSKTDLHAALTNLQKAYELKGNKVTDSLLPGLSKEDVISRCQWFPSSLPDELVALYGWHEGQESDVWSERYPFLFRDNGFSRLSLAEENYHSMMNSYGSVFSDTIFLKYAFPFAAFNGAFFVIPTQGHPFDPRLPFPVISVFEGIEVYFYSLQTMVDTCVEWVNHPKYHVFEGLPRDIEMLIWEKHNPGIFS